MKRHLFLLIAFLVSAGMLATQSLSAQKRVIKVQGHPHEYLTDLIGGKEDAIRAAGSTYNIVLDSIKCWAGNPDPSLPIDSAVLLVKWTDGKRQSAGDSILAWGYRWNPVSSGGWPVTKYTIDMIRAVANADCRFSALLQNSSGGDFVVGGFGYNFGTEENSRVPLIFNQNSAMADTLIKFSYSVSPNCAMGQGAIPYDVAQQAQLAIRKSTGNNSNMKGTGIIDHPFNADYGYPAYDFDYWALPSTRDYYEWQSGWYKGYWAFYVKPQLVGDFDYPEETGIATHEITNHSVSGFAFAINMTSKDMSGSYTARTCNCGCNAPATRENVTGKRK